MEIEKAIVNDLHNARLNGIKWACLAYEVMTLMVLHDKFGIEDKEELKKYCNEMGSLSDCMTRDYANLSDFVKVLKEESGFTLSDDELTAIDPGLAGYFAAEQEK